VNRTEKNFRAGLKILEEAVENEEVSGLLIQETQAAALVLVLKRLEYMGMIPALCSKDFEESWRKEFSQRKESNDC